jgi:hypothetical protein
MELTRQTPPGAVPADDLADLVAHPGPFLTVRMTLAPAEADAPQRGELSWGALRERAAGKGANDEALAAIDELVEQIASIEPGFVAVATAEGLLAVEVIEPRWTVDEVRWQALPWFAPIVDARQAAIDHAVVRIDRTGADIDVVVGGNVDAQIIVQGRTHHIRKVGAGGWSQRRYQERAEEAWRANADEAVDRIVRLVRSDEVELVLVGGEARSTALVEDAVPDGYADRVLSIEASRTEDGSGEAEDESIRRALADHVARQTVAFVEELRQAGGRGQAVTGDQDVLDALARAQVAVLLASDGDEDAAVGPILGEGGSLVDQLVDELGVEAANVARMDAACWAAIRSGAAVRRVPAHAVDGSMAALLRWE